jgi:hypothetical protein
MSMPESKPLESVWEAKYRPDSIMMKKAQYNCPDDVIQTGTEAAAGYYPTLKFSWIEKDLFSGARHLETWRLLTRLLITLDHLQISVVENMGGVIYKVNPRHGRWDAALAQSRNYKVQIVHFHLGLPKEFKI